MQTHEMTNRYTEKLVDMEMFNQEDHYLMF